MAQPNKNNKSLMKRVKITGSGKITKRYANQNHFNAKDSGNRGRLKKTIKSVPVSSEKQIRGALPGKF